MRIGAAQRGWLDDRGRQRRTRAAIEAEARAFGDLPAVRRFREELAAADDAGAVEAAIVRLFEAPDWLAEAVVRAIRAARRDPYAGPPWRAIAGAFHRAALLFDTPRAAVALGVVGLDALAAYKRERRGEGSVNFAGRRVLLKFLETGDAHFAFWRAPRAGEAFVRGAAGRCQAVGTRRIAEGELLRLDTGETSWTIAHARAPIVFLHGEVRLGGAPVAREYDARSGRLIGLSSGEDAASRAQLLLTYLRQAGRRDAAPLFAAHVREAPFFVRWHAMREWLALDAEGALPALREMAAGDPHPEVRAAAAATWARLAARPEAA